MHDSICSMVSSIFYGGQLSTSTQLPKSVLATSRKINRYNRLIFRKPGQLIFMDEPHSKDERDARKRSVINTTNSADVYALVLSLLENTDIPGDMITVLTPYRSQLHIYQHLFAANRQLRSVGLHTIDSFQGREAMVVVLDASCSAPRCSQNQLRASYR
jgi:superfamily I DNA and/or RNA helicase